ncbi:MAG: hypothetical protein B6U89_07510 [Desulfurococcales archaeon ex4484_58]|nr:MAG: hypothetical protein B6U89_07510 [Desulfurococcales archaeon ex4484_58]
MYKDIVLKNTVYLILLVIIGIGMFLSIYREPGFLSRELLERGVSIEYIGLHRSEYNGVIYGYYTVKVLLRNTLNSEIEVLNINLTPFTELEIVSINTPLPKILYPNDTLTLNIMLYDKELASLEKDFVEGYSAKPDDETISKYVERISDRYSWYYVLLIKYRVGEDIVSKSIDLLPYIREYLLKEYSRLYRWGVYGGLSAYIEDDLLVVRLIDYMLYNPSDSIIVINKLTLNVYYNCSFFGSNLKLCRIYNTQKTVNITLKPHTSKILNIDFTLNFTKILYKKPGSTKIYEVELLIVTDTHKTYYIIRRYS